MRSSIEQAIFTARDEERCAFIPFLTAGFPDTSTCVEILAALANEGADVIEVGLPFSDPLADGPTIQWASRTALDNGMTPDGVFRIVSQARSRFASPVVIMTYFNPVRKMGEVEFARRAADAGVSGVIIPDLPPEEADQWLEAAELHGLDPIFLVAPNTPNDRMKTIISKTRGFLYYVSTTGVTGTDIAVSPELTAHVKRTRASSDVPVAVGFGISTAEQARAVARVADGLIVGSALIREIQTRSDPVAQVDAACSLASVLTAGLQREAVN
jgi:tryptophan synthase alpha chain